MKYLQGDCAKDNHGIGSGEPGQPFLPCLFCVFRHHLRAVSITHNMGNAHGRKEFSALRDKTNTEGEQKEERFT